MIAETVWCGNISYYCCFVLIWIWDIQCHLLCFGIASCSAFINDRQCWGWCSPRRRRNFSTMWDGQDEGKGSPLMSSNNDYQQGEPCCMCEKLWCDCSVAVDVGEDGCLLCASEKGALAGCIQAVGSPCRQPRPPWTSTSLIKGWRGGWIKWVQMGVVVSQ